jgi:hypothetical protein
MSLKCYFVNIYLFLLNIYKSQNVILTSNWHDPAGLCLFHQYCSIMGPESMYFALIFQFPKLFDKSVAFFRKIFCYECFVYCLSVYACYRKQVFFSYSSETWKFQICFSIFCFTKWMTSPNVLD